MRYKILIVFFLSTILYTSAAENYTPLSTNPILENYRWKTFSELTNKGIRCVAEGADKTIWFGTGSGLYHYNGIEWKRFYKEHEFLKSPIYGLQYTQKNGLYIITLNGICQLKNGKWNTIIKIPPNSATNEGWEVLNSEVTSDKALWIGFKFGLLKIHDKNKTLFTTKQQFKGLNDSFHDVEIIYMDNVFSNVNTFIVYDLLEDKSGNLWLGFEDGRILRLNSKDRNLDKVSSYTLFTNDNKLKLAKIPFLYETKKGHIIATSFNIGGGINDYNPTTDSWEAYSLSEQFSGDDVNISICETDDDHLWIGGFGRIFSFYQGHWEEYKQPTLAIPSSRVILLPVSDGSLWIYGLMSEVIRIEYATPQWQTYKDLLYQCESDNGDQWFLNGMGQVIVYKPSSKQWIQISDELKMTDPVAIYNDNNDRIWILGSHESNAALAWLSEDKWVIRSFPELCWSFHPNGFLHTSDGTIWFGSSPNCDGQKHGLIRYYPKKGSPDNELAWQHYEGSEICEVSYALSETDNHSILCGYFLGLFEYNDTTTRALDKDLKNDLIKVESMCQDPEGGVWIGTRTQGLIHYIDDDNWTQYNMNDGMVSNSVSSVVMDANHVLWVSTDKGISSFDGKNWTSLALPEVFRINRANGYLRIGKDNSLWICNSSNEWNRRVYKTFDYEESPLISYKITPEQAPPQTSILKYDEKVYFPGNTTIIWTGIDQWNATPVEKLQYSFKLDNSEWSTFSEEVSHSFLALTRGNRTLHVKARDNFMNEDLTPATVTFKVIPPIWGQVWFMILMALFIGTIAYLFVMSIRKNKLMQEQHKLMARKNEDLTKHQDEIEHKGKQIVTLLENERENSWINEGIVEVGDVLRKNRDDLESLSKNVLVKIVDYLELHAGALFLFDDDDELNYKEGYLRLISSYGISAAEHNKDKIMPGQGLIGTCFIEKKILNISNVPDSYFIESGLGKAKVENLVLIPLKNHEHVVGVIELSSFSLIDHQKIKFLEVIAENISSQLYGRKVSEKIKNMLNLSKEQTMQLHEQEEEMKQQMEELQATQEESSRKEEELKNDLFVSNEEKKKLRESATVLQRQLNELKK